MISFLVGISNWRWSRLISQSCSPRLKAWAQSSENIQNHFTYELTHELTVLFKDARMRKSQKCKLRRSLLNKRPSIMTNETEVCVIDCTIMSIISKCSQLKLENLPTTERVAFSITSMSIYKSANWMFLMLQNGEWLESCWQSQNGSTMCIWLVQAIASNS